jgi:tight adherence protein B
VNYVLATLFAVVLVAVLEAGRQLYRWSEEKRREELRRRLQALGQETPTGAASLLRDERLAVSPLLDELLRAVPLALRLEKLLAQTDLRATVAQFLAWSVLGGCAGLLGGLLLGLGPLAVATAFTAASVPFMALFASRVRRSSRVSEQLPEALDMLSRSLRAGHALSGAFETVAKEMPEPVAVEFGRVFEAQRLGIVLDRALFEMTERVPGNGDVRMLTVAVTIQRETGGNLAEIFSSLADTIRARYRFFGKLKSLTAEGRASAAVLAILPFVTMAGLKIVNPRYLSQLTHEAGGHLALAYAAVSWLVGVVWLKRMTKVDY